MRRSFGSMAVVAVVGTSLLLALTAPAGAAVPAADPVKVGVDATGDWGGGGDNALVGHALGQDLLSATVGVTPTIANFDMEVTFLPSTGGIPELSRYTWNFYVDNTPGVDGPGGISDAKFFELDGKFTNYSRGACDPTSGQCPPPRDPGPQPFLLRGNCTTDPNTNVTTCQELAKYTAVFIPSTRTIRIPVPVEALGLVPCAVIAGAPNLFGGSISAAPSAFFSSSAAPLDAMDVAGIVMIPTDDPEKPCPAPKLPGE